MFPEAVLGKYLLNAKRKPGNFHLKEAVSSTHLSSVKSEESFKDAMKRAFSNDPVEKTTSHLDSNSYIKLMNSNMDAEALFMMLKTTSPDGLRFLTLFLSNQCTKFQNTLRSIIEVSRQPELEKASKKLFDIIVEVTNAKYGAIYYSASPDSQIKVFDNNWPQERAAAINHTQIFASEAVLRGDLINVYNFRDSDYHSGSTIQDYSMLAPECTHFG